MLIREQCQQSKGRERQTSCGGLERLERDLYPLASVAGRVIWEENEDSRRLSSCSAGYVDLPWMSCSIDQTLLWLSRLCSFLQASDIWAVS